MTLKFFLINFLSFIIINSLFYSNSFAQDSVSIIMYHRFGESNYPTTNIQMEKFEVHINELKGQKYNIMKLSKIVKELRAGRELPEYTVGISIDDAFMSVYTKAWPLLRDNSIPFTIFVATDPIDQGRNGYMSWDQLKVLKDNGVEIGSQTKSHPHMHRLSEEEIRYEISYSNSRFEKELGSKPDLFAYPYGEYNLEAKRVAEEFFIASFGQHSGSDQHTPA